MTMVFLIECVILAYICIFAFCSFALTHRQHSTEETHVCKYELFDHYPDYQMGVGNEMVYVFACKECRKEKEITSREIFKVAKKYQRELKEKQFYENYFDTSNTRLIIGHMTGGDVLRMYENYLIEGYVADETIKHFKKMGIDVSVCQDYVGNCFIVFDGNKF